jgi:GntR family transcriptional repressor for pyruvate dehydrogenase complex
METVKPITKSSFAEQIAANLRRQILSGALEPGEKLPPERKLAKQFGTNRNTLREAIRTLEGLKLVSVRQGDGVRVRDFRSEGEAPILPYFFMEGGGAEERTLALGDLLNLRRLILSEAGALAAKRGDDEDFDALEEHVQCLAEALPEGNIAEMDLEFYHLLVRASHSLTIIWMFNTFHDVYRKSMPIVQRIWVTPKNYLPSLKRLLKALRTGNARSASKIIQTHLAKGDEIVLKKISNP